MKMKRVRSPVSMELPPRPVARSPPRLELRFSLCCSGYRAAAASPATINRLDAREHRDGTRQLECRRTRALRVSALATHFRFSLLPSQPWPLAPSSFQKPLAKSSCPRDGRGGSGQRALGTRAALPSARRGRVGSPVHVFRSSLASSIAQTGFNFHLNQNCA